MVHDYTEEFRLVPIGYWNWKWCPTRARYSTFEQELLSGVLIFSSQQRIIQNLPIVWFCDHEALKYFLDKEPPVSQRLRRWFCFLGQFRIKFHHTPGMRNELCDWLSRSSFDQKYGLEFESLAREAFQKMDSQLDLSLQVLTMEIKDFDLPLNYERSEFSEVWSHLDQWKTEVINDNLWFKSQDKLFCERKLAIPKETLPHVALWLHQNQGHPGCERTLWSFLKSFHSSLTRKELHALFRNVLGTCKTCLLSKPSSQVDRGLIGCLPIPPLCNDVIYLDFVALDEFNNFDYALGIVDGLSRFSMYLPCKKEISGEKVLKMILKEWIEKFGRPNEVISDNDIRFKSPTSFYQESMKKIGVKVSFSVPRHPSSNGLMERENRSFVQTLRCLVQETGSKDWPKLLPFVNFVMNSQVSSVTGFSPSELFQGRPPWQFECSMEPSENPQVEAWVMEQLLLQEKACLRLKHLRSVAHERKNKWRSPAKYDVGSWVLIHKSRWPQRKVDKIDSPWFGPFKVVQVSFNSLMVLASPTLGGLVKVSFSQVKHWSSVHDPHWSDPSPCAGEHRESGDDPASGQFAESSLVTSCTGESERERQKKPSTRDEPGREDEHDQGREEEQPRRDPSPRRTRRTTRERRGARDKAAPAQGEPPPRGSFTGILPSSRTPSSRRIGFPVVTGLGEELGQVDDFQAVQGVQEAQGVDFHGEDVQVVHGEREPVVVLPGAVKKMEYTVDEAEKLGYFNVESILSHKFKFGSWRFLVKWEGFPVSAASWEGIKSFRLPNGRFNTVFAKYVEENGLQEVLGKARK